MRILLSMGFRKNKSEYCLIRSGDTLDDKNQLECHIERDIGI